MMALPVWENAGGEEKVGVYSFSQLLGRLACGSIVCRKERETTRRITEYLEMLVREGGLALKGHCLTYQTAQPAAKVAPGEGGGAR